ncbi:MAG: endonuclease/exonuclease/phosphatase family protein [Clostridia bacterium]|nr:endonuclease/exonuclease/phosphatase family protein [Clostridia bacterium]
MKKKSVGKRILAFVGILLAAVLTLILLLVAFLSIAEFRPDAIEQVDAEGTAEKTLSVGDTVTVMTWNIGYGVLGEDADFFMDGGTMVRAENRETVLKNMNGIEAEIQKIQPDILLLQETDRGSSRSLKINEYAMLEGDLGGYVSAFANNYKVAYIPYPMPPLGTVDSGIATFSTFPMQDNERVQLPVPFSWPVRTINLKRCLLISRIPINGSERELVIVNLHLEAYDEGEGKLPQTKMLADLLKEEAEKGNYVIAGGDFNQVFSSVNTDAVPLYEGNWEAPEIDVRQFGEHFSFLMDETVPSCRLLDQPYRNADRSTFQYYIIDGFIVSDNLVIETVEAQDIGFVYADHNPVVLKVTLR